MYISSNDNRFYAALESEYGKAPAIEARNRIPAVQLSVKQTPEKVSRHDKTGTRTFLGLPANVRSNTAWGLKTYMTSLAGDGGAPAYGPLFEAAMGSAAHVYSGGSVASVSNGVRVQFTATHGLVPGQAVAIGTEIRFVAAVVNSMTVDVNAPFTGVIAYGAEAAATITYMPGIHLPSTSIFDYWSPSHAVQRIITGAAVNQMLLRVNGDFHEFEFAGPAKDLLDSASLLSGDGGLEQFPAEPSLDGFDYSLVPGHLGQVWLGASPERFYTLTDAAIKVDNGLELRAREFGAKGPMCVVPGQRQVSIDLELLAADDDQTTALYQAARQASPIQMMLQLGEQTGQLFGAYMKSVVPAVPEYDDRDARLAWRFKSCRAQGSGEDEIVLAFA
jgi:hypothetical protein